MSKTAGYLGPIASYSHQAALAVFPESYPSSSPTNLQPLHSFTDIFSALEARKLDYGVIPFENSSNGAVIPTLDLLADRSSQYGDIRVVGEYYLPVHHCLLVRRRPETDSTSSEERLKKITKLYTHPQAWGQCEKFLSTHFKGIERQDVSSTSKAAEVVSQDSIYSAAIASNLAAKVSDLEIVTPNIEDSSKNVTRFFIFTHSSISPSDLHSLKDRIRSSRNQETSRSLKQKSLLSFTIPHELPGALAQALKVFSTHGFNLTSIDTRPSRLRPWHYIFFVECESSNNNDGEQVTEKEKKEEAEGDKRVDVLMKDLGRVAESCRIWGSWEDML